MIKNIAKRILAAGTVGAVLAASTLGAYADPAGSTVADVTFTSGGLTLTEVSPFSFGSQQIALTGKNYPATNYPLTVTVVDLRGTREGWELTAVMSEFTLVGGDATQTLPGAMILMNNGATTNDQDAPGVNTAIQLESDNESSQRIATAVTGTGYGSWELRWEQGEGADTNVHLYVPGLAATVGRHEATIDWTLGAAP